MGELLTNYVNPTVFPIQQEFYQGDPPPHPQTLYSSLLLNKEKRISSVSLTNEGTDDGGGKIQSPSSALHKSEDMLNSNNHSYAANQSSSAAASSLSRDDAIASTTRDTVVVMITLTLICFTLIVTYLLWRRRKRSSAHFSAAHCKLEEYRYSRLSQNDVEVDNISFQGDLTHKTSLISSVPVCAEEEGDDDQVQPATLRLEYDSLVSISNEEKENTNSQTSITKDNAPGDLLIDELSDEDLLQ